MANWPTSFLSWAISSTVNEEFRCLESRWFITNPQKSGNSFPVAGITSCIFVAFGISCWQDYWVISWAQIRQVLWYVSLANRVSPRLDFLSNYSYPWSQDVIISKNSIVKANGRRCQYKPSGYGQDMPNLFRYSEPTSHGVMSTRLEYILIGKFDFSFPSPLFVL